MPNSHLNFDKPCFFHTAPNAEHFITKLTVCKFVCVYTSTSTRVQSYTFFSLHPFSRPFYQLFVFECSFMASSPVQKLLPLASHFIVQIIVQLFCITVYTCQQALLTPKLIYLLKNTQKLSLLYIGETFYAYQLYIVYRNYILI